MDPRFTQKTVKFGGGKIMVWGYIQYGGVREICRVEGNINSLPLTFPTIKGAKFCSRMVLHRILPSLHQSSSRRRRSRCSRIGQPITEHVWGRTKEEAWKTKPKNLDELWEACKTAFFAIPDDFINKLYESLPNRMDAVHGSHTRYYIWISQHHY